MAWIDADTDAAAARHENDQSPRGPHAEERCCGDLARDVPITQATVSQHRKILTDAGLVEPRRQGQCAYYRLRWDVFDAYQRTLATALAGTPSRVA